MQEGSPASSQKRSYKVIALDDTIQGYVDTLIQAMGMPICDILTRHLIVGTALRGRASFIPIDALFASIDHRDEWHPANKISNRVTLTEHLIRAVF